MPMTMSVQSIPDNLSCKAIKKKKGELRWQELVFEDELGVRCIPKIKGLDISTFSNHSNAIKEDLSHHSEHTETVGSFSMLTMDEEESLSASRNHHQRPKRRGSLGRFAERIVKLSELSITSKDQVVHHSELNDNSSGSLSVMSIEEEEEESLSSSVHHHERPKRRGSLGRFAERIGKRLVGDDEKTVATTASSVVSISQDDDESSADPPLSVPPPPPLPTQIHADTPHLANRFSFMNKQKGVITQKKYLGYKDSIKKQQIHDERRGKVLSSLYTCMEGDDDEEDLLSSILNSRKSRGTEEPVVRYCTANCAA